MVYRRRAVAFATAIALGCSAGLFAQKNDKKRDDALSIAATSLAKLVDGVAAGTAQPPNDFALTWARDDAFKALGNKEFVPFMVTLDPAKVAAGNVNLYWRVVSKNAPAPALAAPGKNDKNDKKDKTAGPEKYPWEDVNLNVPVAAGADGARIARSFTVAPGDYDVYVACQEPAVPQAKGAPPVAQKVAVIKRAVTVPDFWNTDFGTSSVVVSKQTNPLPAPLTAQQRVDRPYAAFGPIELQPTIDYKLAKKDDLQVFFLIYNPKTDTANKPAVTVEYSFYAKSGGTEKFFNKTPPLSLNAGTLPPQFNIALGHQLQGGQDVPLASFPEGDYRLEIKITDTLGEGKTVTRIVNFTVTAS
jgi:hypothetical protein